MYLHNYNIYASQYQPGIKKISFYKYFSNIIDGKIYLKNKIFDHYDLYFNQSGVLKLSTHYKTMDKPTKKFFAYNNKCKPVNILEFNYFNNELLELSEFTYDEQNRIYEEFIRTFFWNPDFETYEQQIHKYSDNIEEITLSTNVNFKEEKYYTLLKNINDEQIILEEKKIKNSDDIFEWIKYEYDNNGILIKEFWWDKIQNQFVIHPKETEPEIVWEDKFEYNHKGSWIKMITLRNGEPRFYCERFIDYYL